MNRKESHYTMSQLEREFELEMENHNHTPSDEEMEAELESMLDGDESEYEYEEDSPESEYEYEEDPENEYEYGENYSSGSYGERLYELSQREFESEYEFESELDQIVDDMHREFFFGKLFKKLKNSKFAKGLIKKGLKFARPFASFIPGGSLALDGLNAATDLLGENVKSRAKSLGRRALKAIRKEAKALTKDVQAMGVKPENTEEANQAAAQNVTDTIQTAMEFAADNIHYEIDDPVEAERLASRAFEVALQQTSSPTPPVVSPNRPQNPPAPRVRDHRQQAGRGVRVVHLREKPGEEIEKIVIVIRDKPRR
ncbi:MAG: hypothetical protein SF052_18005 [Bacteroidia bacterium]|nr:hypothetical protein [Bacteroidia bacterium]